MSEGRLLYRKPPVSGEAKQSEVVHVVDDAPEQGLAVLHVAGAGSQGLAELAFGYGHDRLRLPALAVGLAGERVARPAEQDHLRCQWERDRQQRRAGLGLQRQGPDQQPDPTPVALPWLRATREPPRSRQ